MRSTKGFCASIVLLLALPVTALYAVLFGDGAEAVIHGMLAVGSALMSLSVFDFKTPKWMAWLGSGSMGLLAAVFLLQGASELLPSESLAHLAYRVAGQGLEGFLGDLFLAWCVAVLALDGQPKTRILGVVCVAAAFAVRICSYGLAWRGTSLDAQAPLAKVLLLTPFVWLLFESRTRRRRAP